MATQRNAKVLLVTLVSALILFLILVATINIPALGKHGYVANFGWQTPESQAGGGCDRALATKGFPLTTQRPANDAAGCLDSTNPLARAMNLALCFVAASVISVALTEGIKGRL